MSTPHRPTSGPGLALVFLFTTTNPNFHICAHRYGDREATTAYIPYGQLFDVTNENVTEKMTVAEYVRRWGQPEELFETEVVETSVCCQALVFGVPECY